MLHFERSLKAQGFNVIIGVDEAGRGPLAGPVTAAAVALPDRAFSCRIDDSKKLTPPARLKAFREIITSSVFGIGIIDQATIDNINILRATRRAMERAVAVLMAKLTPHPSQAAGAGFAVCDVANVHVIVDGNMRIDTGYPCTAIIGGDGKSLSIAAASIVAKVVRDSIMVLYDRVYPRYGFARHKGYPTEEHRAIIRREGLTPIHRRTFCDV